MERGNVLVIGNCGVGKSTLINAVLGEDVARTAFGTHGITDKLSIYESEQIPFRIIDTIGFEPSFFQQQKAIRAVKRWSERSAKAGKKDTQINVIWFCVDGTASKLFSKTLQNISDATRMWPSVPVIVAITKSYSVPDREKNIKMVNSAFAQQRKHTKNLRDVIPVVAQTYQLNDTAYAPPEGITELIDATNQLLPEGIQAASKDISAFKLSRKRALAQTIVGAAAAGAAVVAAVPIPFADAAILVPVEIAEVNAIARTYGIKKGDEASLFIESLVDVGTVSAAAKALISALKVIPGVNIGAAVLNSVIAAGIAIILGETSSYLFEQIYSGNKTLQDIGWAKEVLESSLAQGAAGKIQEALKTIGNGTKPQDAAKAVISTFFDRK